MHHVAIRERERERGVCQVELKEEGWWRELEKVKGGDMDRA